MGNIIAALSQKIGLPQTMELVGAWAAHKAMILAQELCIFKMQVEGDCLKVIQALTTQARCNTLYGRVIEDTHKLGATFQHCQFQHVRRERNKLAHTLNRRAVLFANTSVWVEDLPSDLNDVFQSNLH